MLLKKFGSAAMLVSLFLLFTTFSFAQHSIVELADDDYYHASSNITLLTTTGTVYSEVFLLTDQDAFSWATYPWYNSFTASVPSTGTIAVVNYLQGSFSKTTGFTNLDTLASSDSLLSSTAYIVSSNYNNWKRPYYRWKYTGMATNADSVTITNYWYNPRRDVFERGR